MNFFPNHPKFSCVFEGYDYGDPKPLQQNKKVSRYTLQVDQSVIFPSKVQFFPQMDQQQAAFFVEQLEHNLNNQDLNLMSLAASIKRTYDDTMNMVVSYYLKDNPELFNEIWEEFLTLQSQGNVGQILIKFHQVPNIIVAEIVVGLIKQRFHAERAQISDISEIRRINNAADMLNFLRK